MSSPRPNSSSTCIFLSISKLTEDLSCERIMYPPASIQLDASTKGNNGHPGLDSLGGDASRIFLGTGDKCDVEVVRVATLKQQPAATHKQPYQVQNPPLAKASAEVLTSISGLLLLPVLQVMPRGNLPGKRSKYSC